MSLPNDTSHDLPLHARSAVDALSKGGRRLWDFEDGDYGPFATFVRTGAGTAFTVGGLIQQFATGVPRVTNKGLLLEGASTNVLPWSMDLSNAVWIASAIAKTATSITEQASSGQHSVRQAAIAHPTGNFAFSAIIKHRSGARFMSLYPQGSVAAHAVIDPRTGAVTGSGGAQFVSAGALSLAPGLYLARLTYAASGTPAVQPHIYLSNSQTLAAPTYTGDGTSGVDVLAVQVEAAAPTSPIPTATGSATRGADSAALTVPPGCTSWEAVYGDGRTEVSGSGLTPGASFDLVTGRPWIGLGNELKSVRFAP